MQIWVWQYTGSMFREVTILDNFISVIWVERYNACGEFELYLPANTELIDLLLEEKEVLFSRPEKKRAMIYEKMEINSDAENGNYMIVSGRSAECILERRVVKKLFNFSGLAEDFIRTLIINNAIDTSDEKRNIGVLELSPKSGYLDTLDKQVTGDTLLKAIEDVCVRFSWGFYLEFKDGKLFFQLYKGGNKKSTVIFSSYLGNLVISNYIVDLSNYYNFIWVAGEGEGENRKYGYYDAGTNCTGLYCRELFYDRRDNSSDSLIQQLMYQKILAEKGKECAAVHKISKTCTGKISDYISYQYEVDYLLGDEVAILNDFGLYATATIQEVTEVEDESGHSLVPTLSDWRVNDD